MNTIIVSRKQFGSRSGPMFYLGPNYFQNYFQTILLGFEISLDILTALYRIKKLQKCKQSFVKIIQMFLIFCSKVTKVSPFY